MEHPVEHVRPTLSSWIVRITGILLVGWLLYRERYFCAWMDDDAFISFRYARNLAHGNGLVFNPGERVEGYSNFLWTLLMASADRLGADVPTAAQVLGAVCSVAIIPVLCLSRAALSPTNFGKEQTRAGWGLCVAAMLLCGLEPWAAWAVGGLENALGAFLVTLAFLWYCRGLQSRTRTFGTSGACFALAALAHPSFALFGLIVAIHLAIRAITNKPDRTAVVRFVTPIVIVAVPYLAWKLAYYGRLLPNTFAAKTGIQTAILERGAAYWRDVLEGLPFLVATMVLGPVYLWYCRVRDSRPWILLAFLWSFAVFTVLIGGEAFPAFRLVIVLLPLWALLVQYLIDGVQATSPRLAGVIAAVVLATSFICAFRSGRVRVLDDAIENDSLGMFKAAALMLKESLPPETYLAGSAAGVIPYYSEFRFLDTLGLTDAHIASRTIPDFGKRTAGHEKGDGQYVFDCKPDVIMFGSGPVSGFEPCFLSDYELVAIPEFHARYEQVAPSLRFQHRTKGELAGYVPLYVRKDLPILRH